MNEREQGFLLLTSSLGDADRHPLTVAQLRDLTKRVRSMERPTEDRELTEPDLLALGYSLEMSRKILNLLEQREVLTYYLQKGKRCGCIPITRVSQEYPIDLRKLQLDAPGVLWAKGNLEILNRPRISLVGSRNILPENQRFAEEVGRQAARQGYVLVSGNARGADQIAQESCLAAGGQVIIVAADSLVNKKEASQVLYLCEDSFDFAFSAQRALSRNRVIHCLGSRVFVAQCDYQTGGTWRGTQMNIAGGWTPVFCFEDLSLASQCLAQMGAEIVSFEALSDFDRLSAQQGSLFN